MNQYNPAKQADAIDNVTSTSGKSAEVIDTAKIQAALEKRVDQETASLPRLTVPDIDEDPSSPDPEPAAVIQPISPVRSRLPDRFPNPEQAKKHSSKNAAPTTPQENAGGTLRSAPGFIPLCA